MKKAFLKPNRNVATKIVISSNGHGEDRWHVFWPNAYEKTFLRPNCSLSLVGKGRLEDSGIEVYPPPLDTPSGGVIKYSFFELIKDIRAGLIGHVKRQLDAWSRLRGKIRTPICVGDVYLCCMPCTDRECRPFFGNS